MIHDRYENTFVQVTNNHSLIVILVFMIDDRYENTFGQNGYWWCEYVPQPTCSSKRSEMGEPNQNMCHDTTRQCHRYVGLY